MPERPRLRSIAGLTGLALAGTWLGHTFEYARVWGFNRDLATVAFGSIHLYMLPAAAALALLALVGTARLAGLWWRLGTHRDGLAAALRGQLRGSDSAGPARSPAPSAPRISNWAVLWPLLTVLQTALFLLQENVESVAAGLPAPGLGPVRGVHAAAPLVHAAVALVLVAALMALRVCFRRRRRVIAALESLILHIASRRRRIPHVAAPRSASPVAPIDLLGTGLCRRPPPLRLA